MDSTEYPDDHGINEANEYNDVESNSDEYASDVSLEEEDEELIWRVFYSKMENGEYSSELEHEDDSDISLDGIDDPELVRKYLDLKANKVEKDLSIEEKKRLLISNFTEEQMQRFEAYRRMTINKPSVKKISNSVLGHSIAQNIALVLAGISKLYLGEIVTKAFEVQERENKGRLITDIANKKTQKRDILKRLEEGSDIEVEDEPLKYDGDKLQPLQPHHIREAWRLYQLENSGAPLAQWRREGEADGKMFR